MADASPDQRHATASRKAWLGGVGVAIAMAVVVAFAAALYYVYDRGVRRGMQLTPPVIRAELGPNKVPPAAPGGLEIPHQDKLVYDAIEGNEVESVAEKLLPAPEQPLAKPVAKDPAPPAAPPAADTEVASVIQEAGTDDAVVPVAAPPTDSAAEKEVLSEAVAAPAETVSALPAAAAPVAIPPTPARRTASTTTDPPAYRVQIAAYRSRVAADAGWKQLKAAHRDVLSELEPKVVEVDLGLGKGVFHRLQVGPLADAEAALALCARLNERKQGCRVVRP